MTIPLLIKLVHKINHMEDVNKDKERCQIDKYQGTWSHLDSQSLCKTAAAVEWSGGQHRAPQAPVQFSTPGAVVRVAKVRTEALIVRSGIYITKTNKDDRISPLTFGHLESIHSCEISENKV